MTLSPATPVREIVEEYLYKYSYKTYPVVADGQLIGCVTLDTIKAVPRDQWDSRNAADLAKPCSPENSIEPDADAARALSRMSRNQSSRLMVVDHGHLLGIVALRDLANFLTRKLELEGA